MKIFFSYIKRETATFFGVDEESESAEKQKWLDRRRRMASRKYGALLPEYRPPDPDITKDVPDSMEVSDVSLHVLLFFIERRKISAGLIMRRGREKNTSPQVRGRRYAQRSTPVAILIIRERERERARRVSSRPGDSSFVLYPPLARQYISREPWLKKKERNLHVASECAVVITRVFLRVGGGSSRPQHHRTLLTQFAFISSSSSSGSTSAAAASSSGSACSNVRVASFGPLHRNLTTLFVLAARHAEEMAEAC